MKYFIASDIHGHYHELMHALQDAGYDVCDSNSKLIIDGDLFDRGNQCLEVYHYLYPLYQQGKAIIIKGNHELFLESFLSGEFEHVEFNIERNGFGKTLQAFEPHYKELGLSETRKAILNNYPMLKSFIEECPYYFETPHYVITHAGLDFSQGDFRLGNFQRAVWSQPEYFFEKDLVNEFDFHKTVVVGHRFAFLLREYFHPTQINDPSIYYHDDGQKIGIDGGSYYTKRINVLVIDEEDKGE